MSTTEMENEATSGSFFSNILTPGSSLHPTFLLLLDASLAALFAVLVGLLFLTGSIHFIFLILIELGLWGSIKWFVNELKNSSPAAPETTNDVTSEKDSSTKQKTQ